MRFLHSCLTSACRRVDIDTIQGAVQNDLVGLARLVDALARVQRGTLLDASLHRRARIGRAGRLIVLLELAALPVVVIQAQALDVPFVLRYESLVGLSREVLVLIVEQFDVARAPAVVLAGSRLALIDDDLLHRFDVGNVFEEVRAVLQSVVEQLLMNVARWTKARWIAYDGNEHFNAILALSVERVDVNVPEVHTDELSEILANERQTVHDELLVGRCGLQIDDQGERAIEHLAIDGPEVYVDWMGLERRTGTLGKIDHRLIVEVNVGHRLVGGDGGELDLKLEQTHFLLLGKLMDGVEVEICLVRSDLLDGEMLGGKEVEVHEWVVRCILDR